MHYRRTGRGRLLLLAFLVLSLVVITLDFRSGGEGPLETAKDISTSIVAPIQRGVTTVFRPVGNFFSSLGNLSNLRSQNEELRQRNLELSTDIADAEAIKSENARLRELLGLDESWTTMDRVAAEVIADIPNNYRWAVRIDKGASDGIEEDMAVVAPEGLVGKIISVQPDSSIVLLLIDPQAAVRSRIKDKGHTGIARGNGAEQTLSLEGIHPEANVREGDDVVTSGYDLGIYPPSIPVGEVVSAAGEGADVEQDIEVEPWVDFNALDFVEVLLESGPHLKREQDERGRQQNERSGE